MAADGFQSGAFQHTVKTPALFRAVSTRSTALAIYRALRKRTRLLIHPYRFRWILQVYAFTPHWLWRIITRLFGVHRAFNEHSVTLACTPSLPRDWVRDQVA